MFTATIIANMMATKKYGNGCSQLFGSRPLTNTRHTTSSIQKTTVMKIAIAFGRRAASSAFFHVSSCASGSAASAFCTHSRACRKY